MSLVRRRRRRTGIGRTDPGQLGAGRTLRDGAVRIWVAGATHLVVDVAGAFLPAPTSSDGRFVPMAAQRVVDTRPTGTPEPGGTVTFALPSNVPSDAVAACGEPHLDRDDGLRLRHRVPCRIRRTGNLGAQQRRRRADQGGRRDRPRLVGRDDAGGRIRERCHRRRRRLLHGCDSSQLQCWPVRSGDAGAGARHPSRRRHPSTTVGRARSTCSGRRAVPSPPSSPTGR